MLITNSAEHFLPTTYALPFYPSTKYVPGLLRFDARGQVRFIAGHLPEGQVLLAVRDATIENHQFRDIKVDLTHKNGLADLKLDSHNAGADFTGQVSSRLTSEGRPPLPTYN